MIFHVCVMFGAAFLAACSQILLKSSTLDIHKTPLAVYLNKKVVTAYFILGMTMLMNIYAFTGLEYRFGAVLTSSSYLFIMILSAFCLKEKLTWRCIVGNLLLVLGIAVYSLGEAG